MIYGKMEALGVIVPVIEPKHTYKNSINFDGMRHSYSKRGKEIPNNYLKDCGCGCGKQIWNFVRYDNGRTVEIKYIPGHGSRGKIAYWKFKEVIKVRTSRARARQILKHMGKTECEINNEDCSKRLDCHHIDRNPFNNDPINLAMLCRTHHIIADRRGLSIEQMKITPFVYYYSKGKRRYKWKRI